MGIATQTLPIEAAVAALFQPNDLIPEFYASSVPGENFIGRLELEIQHHPKHSEAIIVAASELLGRRAQSCETTIVNGLRNRRPTIISGADELYVGNCFPLVDKCLKIGLNAPRLLLRDTRLLERSYFRKLSAPPSHRVFLVENSNPEDFLQVKLIMDLVDAEFGTITDFKRLRFAQSLQKIVKSNSIANDTVDHYVDPSSGLAFYPIPKGGLKWVKHAATLPRSSRSYSRDPIGFLMEQYASYVECGVLYSAHILRSDSDLYGSIMSSVRRTKIYPTFDDFCQRNGILTSVDLNKPESELSIGAKTIIKANIALAGRKAVLGQIASRATRTNPSSSSTVKAVLGLH